MAAEPFLSTYLQTCPQALVEVQAGSGLEPTTGAKRLPSHRVYDLPDKLRGNVSGKTKQLKNSASCFIRKNWGF